MLFSHIKKIKTKSFFTNLANIFISKLNHFNTRDRVTNSCISTVKIKTAITIKEKCNFLTADVTAFILTFQKGKKKEVVGLLFPKNM